MEKTAPDTAPTPAPLSTPLSVDIPMKAPMKIPTSEPTENQHKSSQVRKRSILHCVSLPLVPASTCNQDRNRAQGSKYSVNNLKQGRKERRKSDQQQLRGPAD
jgi:hypothetical protein